MKFAILGAGAVGCYYGALLARAGHDVTLIGRAQHVDAIRQRGLMLDSPAFQGAVPIAATTDPQSVNGADAVIVSVKSTDTEAAGEGIRPHLSDGTTVFSFQNGVDNAERLAAVLDRPVIPAAVYVAAAMTGPGEVKHHGSGNVVLGASDVSNRFAVSLTEAGAKTTVSDDVGAILWTKLTINCCYNALSAVTQTPYGRLVNLPMVREVMRDVVEECRAVAQAHGIAFAEDPLPSILAIAAAMPDQTSSTAQDIARARPSEIDHLNGFILRKGAALGIPTPANRVLTAMVKLVEAKSRG